MKNALLILLSFGILNSFGQTIIYFEDFNDQPVGMTTFNVNGSTDHNCGSGEYENGWILSSYNGYDWDPDNLVAKDCSFHLPVQDHDSWMITPAISVGSSSVTVSWTAYTEFDNTSYEIWASKTFDGTAEDLSNFTLVESIINGQGWMYVPHTTNLSVMNLVPGDEVFVAIRNNAYEKGYTFINDLQLTEVQSLDADLKYYDSETYSNIDNIPIKGKVYNNGVEEINSFTLNWSINNETVNTEDFTGLNISSGNFHYFEISDLINYPNEQNELKLFINSVNGQSNDSDPNNDTLTKQIYIVNAPTIEKHVILEDFTGAWCGNCVDAIATTNEMMEDNDHFITVAIHNGDPMANDQSSSMETEYGIFAFPTLMIDRKTIDPTNMISPSILSDGWPCNNWRNTGEDRLQFPTPLEVYTTHTINSSTNEINVDVFANFTDAGASGDLRFNCLLVENNVSGDSEYDQSNYRDNVSGHPYEGMGNPIVGFIHQHVFRTALGGVEGTENVIPETVIKGESFQTSYSFTIPQEWDINNLMLIGLVHAYDEHSSYREIYNASESDLIISIPEAINTESGINIFPNPNTGIFNIEIEGSESLYSEFTISDIHGKIIMKKNISENGPNQIDLSGYDKGLYFVKFQSDKFFACQKLIIN